jgi:hypothetical protein
MPLMFESLFEVPERPGVSPTGLFDDLVPTSGRKSSDIGGTSYACFVATA